MSTVNKVNPLQGYRIAFLRNITNVDNLRSVREAGADTVTFPHDGPSSGYDPDIFLNWWIRERDRAVKDQVQLVVVKLYSASAYYRLQRVEEDEWYSQGDLRTRVRFTTLKKLEVAVSCEEPLKDDWGDIIESFDQSSSNDQIMVPETIGSSTLFETIQNESIE